MSWYFRVRAAINAALLELLLTQKVNLALLVSAVPKKRTFSVSPNSPELTPRPKSAGCLS
jgi:hypothetical protein